MSEDLDDAFGGEDPFVMDTRQPPPAPERKVFRDSDGNLIEMEEPLHPVAPEERWQPPHPRDHPLHKRIIGTQVLAENSKGVTAVWVKVRHEKMSNMARGALGIARRWPGEKHRPKVGRCVAILHALELIQAEIDREGL